MYFRGINLKDYFNILDIRRNILPPQFIARQPKPMGPGSIFVKQQHLEDSIEVDIEIKGEDKNHLRAVISILASKLMGDEKPGKLIFTDEPEHYYLAILEGSTNLNEFYLYGTTTLTFLLPDPIKYGREIRFSMPDGLNTFYNFGTFKTRGKLRVEVNDMTKEYVKITREDTGEFIYIAKRWPYDDFSFIIDFIDEKVEDMQGNSMMRNLTLDSDFFDIPTGECKIRLENVGNGELVFRERWL